MKLILLVTLLGLLGGAGILGPFILGLLIWLVAIFI